MTTPPLDPTHVDIGAIEHELTALWPSAAESADGDRSAPITRTCLANLVVVVDDRAVAQQATQVIDRLTAIYPNRAIVAAALPGDAGAAPEGEPAAPALDAWVQAHCQIPVPGRPQVCGEQITVEAHGPAAARIPGVVLPLLVPDVPVAIWLPRGGLEAHPAAARLADVADRLIVDSATLDSPEGGLAPLAGLIDADTGVSDLCWARLTRWRELVAQFFDTPALRQHLAAIERLEVTVFAEPGARPDRSAALLLAGWMASRLGWRVEGRGAAAQLLRPDGVAVRLEVAAVAPSGDPHDQLSSVVIGCPQARFAVSRTEGTDFVVTRAEAEGLWPIQRTVRLQCLDVAALVAGELQLLGHDRAFEEALRVAAALAQ